jgi:hypothetical protein
MHSLGLLKQGMQIREGTYPVISRKDAGLILISELMVRQEGKQQQIAHAMFSSVIDDPWPGGLLSFNVYVCEDRRSVLQYWQWESEASYLLHKKINSVSPFSENIELAVGEVNNTFHLYRSIGQTKELPGCIVIAYQFFEKTGIVKQWIDAIIEAVFSEISLVNSSGLAGHFHVSQDQLCMVNYAEWKTAQAHQAELDRSRSASIGNSPLWKKAKEIPGLRGPGSFKRYTFLNGVTKK